MQAIGEKCHTEQFAVQAGTGIQCCTGIIDKMLSYTVLQSSELYFTVLYSVVQSLLSGLPSAQHLVWTTDSPAHQMNLLRFSRPLIIAHGGIKLKKWTPANDP